MSLFDLAKPFLHKMDAEDAHRLAITALAAGVYPRELRPDPAHLARNVFGITFPNPIGLAAGFDKNAEIMDGMLAHGFGFVEIGTITPKPQIGNPRPRVFRDPTTQSVVNAMGFPNTGMDVAVQRLTKWRRYGRHRLGLVGINIGKNKETADAAVDYEALIDGLTPFADYLTVNISSPNTPGLRDLQKPEFLGPLLTRLLARTRHHAEVAGNITPLPMLVKLSPDNDDTQMRDVADVLLNTNVNGTRVAGVILTNTTLKRPPVLPTDFAARTGGLSGPLLADRARAVLHDFKNLVGDKLPIISVGGVNSAAEARARLDAGAALVQLYTALVFEGPELVGRIKSGL